MDEEREGVLRDRSSKMLVGIGSSGQVVGRLEVMKCKALSEVRGMKEDRLVAGLDQEVMVREKVHFRLKYTGAFSIVFFQCDPCSLDVVPLEGSQSLSYM